jgi:cell division protein FtsL
MTAPAGGRPPSRQGASSQQAPASRQGAAAQHGAAGPAVSRRREGQRARLTSRAAVLAVVLCAIALSLAYPVREYIAQQREIDQLEAQHQEVAAQLRMLEAQQRELSSPAYVEQLARNRLHMCMPTQTCYVIIGRTPSPARATAVNAPGAPWYQRLWNSVEQADKVPAR